MLAGSMLVILFPAPKNRVKAICLSLLLSMGTENFLLAFGRTPIIWYIGSILGWLSIPLMNANLDVILRTSISADMQGRVFSCRNTLQFFSIPVGFLLGGLLVDRVLEPWMASVSDSSLLVGMFGSGKGSGAALLFFILGIAGVLVCIVYWIILRKYVWDDKDGFVSTCTKGSF